MISNAFVTGGIFGRPVLTRCAYSLSLNPMPPGN
jgi:hypothetical protein